MQRVAEGRWVFWFCAVVSVCLRCCGDLWSCQSFEVKVVAVVVGSSQGAFSSHVPKVGVFKFHKRLETQPTARLRSSNLSQGLEFVLSFSNPRWENIQ
jgi:hypothetical protein